MNSEKLHPVLRAGLALVCVIFCFTLWGVFGNIVNKEPASVPMVGKSVSEPRTDSSRKLLLKGASGIEAGKKNDKEDSVLLNDPFIKEKWGLTRTNAQRAWSVSQGSKDIVVAVIDTGIDVRHKDLSENLWVNPREIGFDKNGKDKSTNGVDDDGNGFVDDVHGWNFVTNSNDLSDNHGHGTHIAGIIGARGGNGFGISGVAPKVSIMTLKYYDPKAPGANNLKNTIQAMRYAIKMGAKIINYSGGGSEFSAEEHSVVKEAEKKGILFIAAAGNERSNTDDPSKHYYPADYELSNIISVTAVNETETKVLPSSNYGVRTVDLAAPGDQIYSTLPNNSFGRMTGTSQATAFTTGVAVLIMAHRPEFSATDVKKYILRTGDEYSTLLSKTGTAKLLNAYKALTSLDMGISITGQATANTERTTPFTFSADPSVRAREVNPSAMRTDPNSMEPAEQMSAFGKNLLNAIGSTTPQAREPSRISPSQPGKREQDPNR